MEQEQEGRLGRGAVLIPGSKRGSGVSALGPWLLLFPAVFLGIAVAWIADRRPARGPAPRPPAEAAAAVPAWSGEAAVAGGRLHARLTPLHTSAERQDFERAALGARLRPGEGEPWRLVLRFAAGPAAAAESGPGADADNDAGGDAGPDAGPDPGGAAGRGLSLARLDIVDAAGRRLAPLAPPQPAAGQPVDPLATLLAPPAEDLSPGQVLHLVLWGPVPGKRAVLRGIRDLGGPAAEGSGGSIAIPLEPGHLIGLGREGILARGGTGHPSPGRAHGRRAVPLRAPASREDGTSAGVPGGSRTADEEAADAWHDEGS